MNYAERERNPAKHLPSIAMVVLLHIIIGYALVTGLARHVVEVLKQPLETKIIEEIKKPPPETAAAAAAEARGAAAAVHPAARDQHPGAGGARRRPRSRRSRP